MSLTEKFCIKFVIDNGLFQLVTFPTRGFNILDLLLVDDKYLAFNIICLCPFSISDHSVLSWQKCIIISDSKLVNTRPVSTVKYNFACADYYSFNQYFSSVDRLALFTSAMCNDIEGL